MKKPDSPLFARIALGVPALIGLSIPYTFAVTSYRNTDLLIHTAQVTDGRIIERHCKNHSALVFSYSVNGKSYRGGGHAGVCVRTNCDETELGAPVQVMYSSRKPQVSDCISPDADLETRIRDNKRGRFSVFIFPAILTLFVFSAIFSWTRIDDKKQTPKGRES